MDRGYPEHEATPFACGERMGVSTVSMPIEAKTWSKLAVNLVSL
jgi:hypothetical protein